jgi:hypothetical protein
MSRLGLEHAAKLARSVFFRPRLSIVVAPPIRSATNLADVIFGVLAHPAAADDGVIRSEPAARQVVVGAQAGSFPVLKTHLEICLYGKRKQLR